MMYRSLKNWKYQMTGWCVYEVDIPGNYENDWMDLRNGFLHIKAGYCWDGPSGPTIDTENFMRGSLIHDALYQLMREGKISLSYRRRADELLREICLKDGMSRLRAWWVYWGVRLFARFAAL
jgi:hypothetical protein